MTVEEDLLNTALLDAHQADNKDQLIGLYTQAADQKQVAGDIEACCFFLTQAFVFALETGSSQAQNLNSRLVALGREVSLSD